MILILNKLVEIEVEPEELASMFCNMDSEQQAIFFNEIAAGVKSWDASFAMQMQYLTDDKTLNNEGRAIMQTIGTYAYPSGPSS